MLARTTTNCLILLQNEPDWMLQFRLKAYRQWLTMEEPKWSDNTYTPINYQKISYYSEPKFKEKKMSLDEVDPELLRTFDKLGIPLNEQKRLSNVAVDAVFDSVSIATTFRADLMKAGVIFCSISEAVKEYPELVKKHMGSVVSGDAHGLHGGWRAHASMHAWPLLRRDRAANAALLLCSPLYRCLWETTTSRLSTRRCSPTAPLCTSPRASGPPWSCQRTSGSTRQRQGRQDRRLHFTPRCFHLLLVFPSAQSLQCFRLNNWSHFSSGCRSRCL